MATTNEKKITRVEALTVALNLVESATLVRKDEVAQKIKDIIAQIEKKNSATSGKLSPRQMANEGIKANVLAFMRTAPNQLFTISELMKRPEGIPEEMTNQWMNALLRQMYDKENPNNPDFPIRRSEEKGKAYFQVNPYFVQPESEDEE